MTEHKICKDCKWNNYPECKGTIVGNGTFMNIENLKEGFQCGQKDDDIPMDFSIKKKSEFELLKEKVLELEQEIEVLKNV